MEGRLGPGSTRITITPGVVEHLAAGFAKTWQRPPTQPELKGLIDDYVKEEIATREAVAMGLDRDDTIIRRRLRQKLEFLIEDASEQAPPTDAELQAWLDKNPQAVRLESHVALRQVYFSAEKHGDDKVEQGGDEGSLAPASGRRRRQDRRAGRRLDVAPRTAARTDFRRVTRLRG